MEEKRRWIAAMLLSAVCGMWFGILLPAEKAQEEAAPAFSVQTDSLFETESPPFSIEVVAVQPAMEPKRVLIYHSHTYEAYEQTEDASYQETEKWRTADPEHNVVRVGEELTGLLRALGMEVVHDTSAFEPPALSSAYTRSLEMLENRLAAGENYDLCIDLHRDAYAASYSGRNTVSVGGAEVARLMMLVGKGEGVTGEGFDVRPDWEYNRSVAQTVTDALNAQVDGICRDVCIKSGRFNQHVAQGCILIEAGNNVVVKLRESYTPKSDFEIAYENRR